MFAVVLHVWRLVLRMSVVGVSLGIGDSVGEGDVVGGVPALCPWPVLHAGTAPDLTKVPAPMVQLSWRDCSLVLSFSSGDALRGLRCVVMGKREFITIHISYLL